MTLKIYSLCLSTKKKVIASVVPYAFSPSTKETESVWSQGIWCQPGLHTEFHQVPRRPRETFTQYFWLFLALLTPLPTLNLSNLEVRSPFRQPELVTVSQWWKLDSVLEFLSLRTDNMTTASLIKKAFNWGGTFSVHYYHGRECGSVHADKVLATSSSEVNKKWTVSPGIVWAYMRPQSLIP